MSATNPQVPPRAHPARRLMPLVLVALCLPALAPLLSVPAWQSHDGLHHIFRSAAFEASLRSGIAAPRWLDALGFGYGFPVTHYYAPLAYYLVAGFHALGAGVLDGIKLAYALGFIGTALGAYWLARELLGRVPAALAAIAYAYYPYHLADVTMRGTLTEFLALALLPPLVWSARRLSAQALTLRAAAPYAALSAVLLATLLFTHNLTAFLFVPALAAYLVLRFRGDGLRRAALPLGAAALGFALSALYSLPALWEVNWIRAGKVSGDLADMPTLLTPLARFVSGDFWVAYRPEALPAVAHPLGLVAALVAVLALLAVVMLRAALSPELKREAVAWTVLAGASIFAMTELSAPVWAILRPLALVQFPFRLHAVLGLALAMGIGLGAQAAFAAEAAATTPAGADRNGMTRARALLMLAAGLCAVLLIASPLGAQSLQPQTLPGSTQPLSDAQVNLTGMAAYDYQTALWARLYGDPWLFEYMPAWTTVPREEFFLPRASASPDVPLRVPIGTRVSIESYAPESRAVRMQSTAPLRLSFHTFFFPSWQARVDGAPVQTYPSGALGLASADVPAGAHRVTLSYETTPARRLGQWLSLGAAVVWLALVACWRKTLALLFAVALLLASQVPGAAAAKPAPILSADATFESRLSLIGYRITAEPLRPGDVAEITLFWFARGAPTEDYKVFLHVDGAGGRAGQSDSQPGFGFTPTTRWQAGEIFADTYRVPLKPGTPPGAYEIFAGMYRMQPLQNLRVESPAATPDNRVRLGVLAVRP